jgi:hypothetical protein
MRDETALWLNPMLNAANDRDIDTRPLMMQAMMPAAEAATPFLHQLGQNVANVAGIDLGTVR